MNRVVRDHYPAKNLPEDLRGNFRADEEVRVVIEANPLRDAKKPLDLQELFDRARPSFRSPEEVADHINAIRDDWE